MDINTLTQEICINRGDTGQASLFINAGSDLNPIQYRLGDNDCIYMAIERPNQPFEKAVVKKVMNNSNSIFDKDGCLIINFESEDTLCLEPGLYYYEIKAKIYRENIFRNLYTLLIFNDDGTFCIKDTEHEEIIMEGTYTLDENEYHLISESSEQFEGTLVNGILRLDNGDSYIQEKNGVETLIGQTQFIVER